MSYLNLIYDSIREKFIKRSFFHGQENITITFCVIGCTNQWEKLSPETPEQLNYFCIMHKIYSKENKEKLETGNSKMLCVTDDKQGIG